MWCSHADSTSLSCFELKFRIDGRRVWADSLSREANAAGTRVSSDIVVECTNERCKPVVSKCMLNESNKLMKLLKTNGVDSYSPLFLSPRFNQEPG